MPKLASHFEMLETELLCVKFIASFTVFPSPFRTIRHLPCPEKLRLRSEYTAAIEAYNQAVESVKSAVGEEGRLRALEAANQTLLLRHQARIKLRRHRSKYLIGYGISRASC